MRKQRDMGNYTSSKEKKTTLIAKNIVVREINNGALLSFYKMPKTKGAKPRFYEFYFRKWPDDKKVIIQIDAAGKRKT